RHTRFSRDWSSDVCSSDLDGGGDFPDVQHFASFPDETRGDRPGEGGRTFSVVAADHHRTLPFGAHPAGEGAAQPIGEGFVDLLSDDAPDVIFPEHVRSDSVSWFRHRASPPAFCGIWLPSTNRPTWIRLPGCGWARFPSSRRNRNRPPGRPSAPGGHCLRGTTPGISSTRPGSPHPRSPRSPARRPWPVSSLPPAVGPIGCRLAGCTIPGCPRVE